ncbi:MAG: hypothetical protein JNL82_33985 [Myxococcales bacterium]|nr:hypothetical protein [Myxococcales bacterium]
MRPFTSPRALPLLAALALAACPGADPPLGDDGDASTSALPASTSTAGEGTSAPTETGDAVTTANTGDTSLTGDTGDTTNTITTDSSATDTGDTTRGSLTTDSTDTGSTDTGAVDCEPSWVVPDVAGDALAAHDLAWVGCELTACGPDDAPGPGEPSVLCAPLDLADVPLTYLGHQHINATGAFTEADVVAPDNFSWLDGMRHIYRYDQHIYIMTVGDGPADQLEVYYAVRALEVLRTGYPEAWQQLLIKPFELPAEDVLDGFGWKNRLRSLVLSFDPSPFYIAAGLTILDTAPIKNMQSGLDEYNNVAAISLDSETILGTMPDIGSEPIYMKPTADENFLRYMREGAVETLVHELLHTRIDRLNSVDPGMNLLYDHRVDNDACAKWELEEALVAAASLLLFRKLGGVGETYLDYYDVVLEQNLTVVEACPDYADWQQLFESPSGVDPRYDLRLLDLD